jgi:hypothetical protein
LLPELDKDAEWLLARVGSKIDWRGAAGCRRLGGEEESDEKGVLEEEELSATRRDIMREDNRLAGERK